MTTFSGPLPETEPGIGALTFGGLLDEVRDRFGQRPALVYSPPHGTREVWSYEDLRNRAREVAKALLAAGLSRGTRVAVLMGARPEWVAAVWGAAMAGGVAVPFSTFAPSRELDYMLRHSDVSVVLTENAFLDKAFVDELLAICPEARTAAAGTIRSADYPFLRRIIGIDSLPTGAVESWESFVGGGAGLPDAVLDAILQGTVPSDDGLIIYSSGTTSLPKGVLHRHRSPMRQCWRHAYKEQFTPEDRVFNGLPLFWTAGFAAVLGATLAAGACLVMSSYFDASAALRLIEEEKVSIVQCLENQAADMQALQCSDPRDLSTVRRDLFRFIREMPPETHRMLNRASYGSSETFTSITAVLPEFPLEERSTYGSVTPGARMRILDPQSGAPLGPGEEGEIILKGITVMRGYVKVAPEDTFDEEGYFHTGDLGWFDEKGLLHFTSRMSGMIKTSGANVAPVEVEQVLLTHPDVDKAVVVGVPDPSVGEVVVACVVPQAGTEPTEEQLRDHLRGKVSSFKIPRRVFLCADGELPRTASERYNLPAVRALAAVLLSRDD